MKKALFNLLFLSCILQMSAQGPAQHRSKFLRKIQKMVWTAGISGVVIDDDGRPFKKLFDVKDGWSLVPFPSRLTLEGYLEKGWSVEGGFTYSKLKKGKVGGSDDRPRPFDASLFAFDACVKYDLNEVIGDTKAFSPYAIAGLGYTYRALPSIKNVSKSGIMADIGLGFTIWFYKGFGFNAQSMAKFAINPKSSNYLMHSIGIVYRFNLITGYKTPGRLGHRYNLFRN